MPLRRLPTSEVFVTNVGREGVWMPAALMGRRYPRQRRRVWKHREHDPHSRHSLQVQNKSGGDKCSDVSNIVSLRESLLVSANTIHTAHLADQKRLHRRKVRRQKICDGMDKARAVMCGGRVGTGRARARRGMTSSK